MLVWSLPPLCACLLCDVTWNKVCKPLLAVTRSQQCPISHVCWVIMASSSTMGFRLFNLSKAGEERAWVTVETGSEMFEQAAASLFHGGRLCSRGFTCISSAVSDGTWRVSSLQLLFTRSTKRSCSWPPGKCTVRRQPCLLMEAT